MPAVLAGPVARAIRGSVQWWMFLGRSDFALRWTTAGPSGSCCTFWRFGASTQATPHTRAMAKTPMTKLLYVLHTILFMRSAMTPFVATSQYQNRHKAVIP